MLLRLIICDAASATLLALRRFGKVCKGMDVVKKVEGYGSSSGKTRATIAIADCGQLA